MNKYRIHIVAKTEEDLKNELREAAEILTGLYDAVDDFDSNFGHERAIKKNKCKNRAKEWVDKHKVRINDGGTV